jgi:hypothetical protein
MLSKEVHKGIGEGITPHTPAMALMLLRVTVCIAIMFKHGTKFAYWIE